MKNVKGGIPVKNKATNEEVTEKKQGAKGAFAKGASEAIFEIVLSLLAFVVGFVILLASGVDFYNVDGDLVMLLGVVVSAVPVGIGILIYYIISKRCGRKKVNYIYKTLRKKYDLKTVVLTRKMHGEYTDVYVLKGQSYKGSFELYRDGEELVFAPSASDAARLATVDEAIFKIEEFMS